jgi:hypothetical protein
MTKRWLVLLILTTLSCSIVRVTPLPVEIPEGASAQGVASGAPLPAGWTACTGTPAPGSQAGVAAASPAEATATPAPSGTPTPTPLPTRPPVFLESMSMSMKGENLTRMARALPRHGFIIAVLLPLLFFGLPWLIVEFFIIRYVQPRGIDLSSVRLKAQDGLFIEAAVSMTARRSLTLASTRMTWPRVREFVEKIIEQELIHDALSFATLDDLQRGMKGITENFINLPVVKELSRDFGLEVLRFNVETRYPPETMEALNRRAEASAGGAAYIAFAVAAHYDPDAPESRELYRVFQETVSQVDAARNLGGGISSLANLLSAGRKETPTEDVSGD